MKLSKKDITETCKSLGISNADIIFDNQKKFTTMLDLVFNFVQKLVDYPEHSYKLPKFAPRSEPIPEIYVQGIEFLNKSLLLHNITNSLNLNQFGIGNYHNEKYLIKFFTNIINLGRFNIMYVQSEQNAAREKMAVVTDHLNQMEIQCKQILEEAQNKEQSLNEMNSDDIDSKYESLISAIDKQQKKIDALKQKTEAQNLEIQKKTHEIEDNRSEIERIRQEIKSFDDILNIKPDEVTLKLENAKSNLEIAKRTTNSMLDMRNMIKDDLDSFKQFYNIFHANRDEFQKYKNRVEKQKDVDLLAKLIAEKRESLNGLRQLVQDLRDRKDAQYESANKKMEIDSKIKTKISNLKKKLKLAKEGHRKDLNNIRYQIEDIRTQLDSFNRDVWKMMSGINEI